MFLSSTSTSSTSTSSPPSLILSEIKNVKPQTPLEHYHDSTPSLFKLQMDKDNSIPNHDDKKKSQNKIKYTKK